VDKDADFSDEDVDHLARRRQPSKKGTSSRIVCQRAGSSAKKQNGLPEEQDRLLQEQDRLQKSRMVCPKSRIVCSKSRMVCKKAGSSAKKQNRPQKSRIVVQLVAGEAGV